MAATLSLISLHEAASMTSPPTNCQANPNSTVYAWVRVGSDGSVSVVGQDTSGGLRVTAVEDITGQLQSHGWFHPSLTPTSLAPPVPSVKFAASVACTNTAPYLQVVFGQGMELTGGWAFGDKYVGKPFDAFLKQHGWATCQDLNIPEYAVQACCGAHPSANPALPSLSLSAQSLVTVSYEDTPGYLEAILTPVVSPLKAVTWKVDLVFVPQGLPDTQGVVLSTAQGPASTTKVLSTASPTDPKVMNGAFPLTYYATWNGVDAFILVAEWKPVATDPPQTRAASEDPAKIQAFLKQLEPHLQPSPPPSPPSKACSQCPWTDWKIIALGSAAAAFLIVAIVLAVVLAMKTK